MVEEGLKEVDTYVLFCQNTITQYIENYPALELFIEVERRLGSRVAQTCWEQKG